jgi:tagatose 1,6-diphosphate aldolase GatY/KbaY
MEARFSELLARAQAEQAAVGAFTCYNLEQAAAVLLAAEERGCGVILLVSAQSFQARAGRMLMAALVAAARRSSAPACVQLDHVRELAPIREAFALGAGAVMADGSHLPLQENAAFVRAAVSAAAPYGGEVEAELGRIEGDEDAALGARTVAGFTDPEEAAELVERSGAACLAVAIGNVHGAYPTPPALDWQRLQRIHDRVAVPLSLHGASGLPESDLARAIRCGVVKVNVNTELRKRYLEATAARLEHARGGFRLLDLHRAQVEAVAETVAAKLAALKLA